MMSKKHLKMERKTMSRDPIKCMQKALDTLRSIRGPNSITLLKKHAKKLMGKDF